MRILLLPLLALAACGTAGARAPPSDPMPTHSPAAEEEPASGRVIDFTRSWDGWDDETIGCIPFGPTKTLRGTLRVRPFGRKGQGTVLVLDGGEALVVAYGQTDQHRELDGVSLLATGRYCDKQLQAANGRHFHVETLTLSE